MVKKIQINMSNKSFYMFVMVGLIVLVVGVVYAYGGSNPSVMGHSIDEIAPPIGCSGGQVLGWSGSSWQCVNDEGGEIADVGCPDGYEPFTNQLGESCILKDDWSESGSMSASVGSGIYSAKAESRMYNGKRQVRITNCKGGWSGSSSCTSDWSNDITSCKYYIFDVYNYGCVATVSDRYTVRITNENLYLDQYKLFGEASFGPGTVDAIAKYLPPLSLNGIGVEIPKGDHKGGCIIARSDPNWNEECVSESWPGSCLKGDPVSTLAKWADHYRTVSCSCENGYRLVYRLDLSANRIYHYDCVKE